MGMIREFREFAVKGNMVDMAVGIIIGGAFGKCVSSLVADVLMPPLGMLMGKMDFSDFKVELASGVMGADGKALPPVDLRYGVFLNSIIDFVIVAFAVFLLVKGINQLRRMEAQRPAAPPAPTTQEKLLAEIRDVLKASA